MFRLPKELTVLRQKRGWKVVSAINMVQKNCRESVEEEELTASGGNKGRLSGRCGIELNSERVKAIPGGGISTGKRIETKGNAI